MNFRTTTSGQRGAETRDVAFAPIPRGASPAHRQTILDMARFSREIGFRPIMARKTLKSASEYYPKLFGAWVRSRIFLSLYPLIGGIVLPSNRWRNVDPHLLHFLHLLPTNTRSILYVNDLPIEQNIAANNQVDKMAYALERRILDCFDILCVCNRNVRHALMRRYGFESSRFVEFEILDYGVDFAPAVEKAPSRGDWTIVYTGNCGMQHLGSWFKDLPHLSNIHFDFFGPGCDWVSERSDIMYRGMFGTTRELAKYISTKADFGLIASSDNYKNFYEYTSSSKFATYVAAGVPVLVRADYEYVSSLVKKYGVGLVFDAYEELPTLMDKMTGRKFTAVRDKCLKLGLGLRRGHFFKTAIAAAMRKLQIN
jgi:hypothetical protein